MLRSDFQRHFQLLLSVHGGPGDRELNYPEWLALKRGIYKLLAEAGSESRCAHKEPLYQGVICEVCGRKPARDNTLPPPEAA
jgi:hypothetical protein